MARIFQAPDSRLNIMSSALTELICRPRNSPSTDVVELAQATLPSTRTVIGPCRLLTALAKPMSAGR